MIFELFLILYYYAIYMFMYTFKNTALVSRRVSFKNIKTSYFIDCIYREGWLIQ